MASSTRRGLALGITAYIIWGLFPLYFKTLQAIPALEIIVHRVLWSALGGALLLLLWKHPAGCASYAHNPGCGGYWRPAAC